MQVLDAMEKPLLSIIADEPVAESLDKHIRCLVGNPVPDTPAQAEDPNEQGEGQREPRSE